MQIFANSVQILSILKEFPNLMITRERCSYCERAKMLLDDQNIGYHEIKSEAEPALIRETQEYFKYSTFPMIFLDKTFIEGHSELKKLVETGGIKKYKTKLKNLLYSANDRY